MQVVYYSYAYFYTKCDAVYKRFIPAQLVITRITSKNPTFGLASSRKVAGTEPFIQTLITPRTYDGFTQHHAVI
jgi:hypothetical protein